MKNKGILIFFGLLLAVALACSAPVRLAAVVTETSQPSPTMLAATEAPTAISTSTDVPTTAEPTQPAPTTVPSDPPPTATSGPQCTVLKRLNFRKGPGTAYNPPVGVLDVNSEVVPKGYNPQGTPNGAWLQVLDPVANQIGWVIAASDSITCNIDMTRLPSVAVQPPPPPPAPQLTTGQVEGATETGKLKFAPGSFLMELVLFTPGKTANGENIKKVDFIIAKAGQNKPIYTRTESKPRYCVFGGDDQCNSWPQQGYGVYTWGSNGPQVEPGKYDVAVIARNGNGDEVCRWSLTLTIQ